MNCPPRVPLLAALSIDIESLKTKNFLEECILKICVFIYPIVITCIFQETWLNFLTILDSRKMPREMYAEAVKSNQRLVDEVSS